VQEFEGLSEVFWSYSFWEVGHSFAYIYLFLLSPSKPLGKSSLFQQHVALPTTSLQTHYTPSDHRDIRQIFSLLREQVQQPAQA
jgi:hypothetical protein